MAVGRTQGCRRFALQVISGLAGTMVSTFHCAQAQQVLSDTTLPQNSVVTVNGSNFTIIGGTQRGGNLFHSFREFSVPTNGSAFFNNALTIQNIISRVTGLSVSNIDGVLRANGKANLFLINPNGIVFGPNARLDIGGSFVGTTANAIQFGNLGFFSASTPEAPLPLLTINPSALLFNQLSPASITNKSTAPTGINPAGVEVTGLRVPDGRSLLLLGGDVNVDGGSLRAYEGRIELAGLAAPGTVGLNVADNILSLSVPDSVTRANVFLTNGAEVNVRGANDGSITINAHDLNLAGASKLRAGIDSGLGTPQSKAGEIVIKTTGSTTLSDSSLIANVVQSLAVGKAGNININTGSLSLSNGANLNTDTDGKGDGGSVFVQASGSVSLANSYIFSNVEAGGVGKGGNIDLKAGSLSITDGAQLQTIVRQADGTQPAGRGDAGNVSIDVRGSAKLDGVNRFPSAILSYVDSGATGNAGDIKFSAGSLDIINGARLSSSTLGTGNAGNVNINVGNAVTLSGLKNGFSSAVLSTVESGGVGKGGNIDLKAGSLSITDGAQLSSSTYGIGNAGNVSIDVGNAVTLSGLNNGLSSAVFSTVESGGVGKGGNIDLKAGSLSITDGAQLQTIVREADGTQPAGKGDAGNVSIDVRGAAKLDGVNGFPSGIFSLVDSGATGNAGDIKFSAGSLDITNGARLSSSTYGIGNAGNVNIDVGNTLTLAGVKNGGSTIFSTVEPGGVGKGGNIDLKAGSLSITDGAQLQTIVSQADGTQPAGKGDAGNVSIDVRGSAKLDGVNRFPSAILSYVDSGATGNAGDIKFSAGSLDITNGAQLSSSTYGIGNAGNVSIDVGNAVTLSGLNNGFSSAVLSTVESGGVGKGGNIDLKAGSLSITDGAQLSSSTLGIGNAGNVSIDVGNAVTLSGLKNGLSSAVFSTVESGGVGKGGNIDLKAGSLSITDGAQLQTIVREADGTQPAGKGDAGNVSIDVRGAAKLDGVNRFPSGIFSAVDSGATGNAGDIKFSAGSLDITNGARLRSSTYGTGNAGNVSIDVGNAVTLSGLNNGFTSAVFSTVESGGVGKGGNIDLKAGSLSITDGAELSSSTYGTGNAGNVNINVGNSVTLARTSAIFSTVEAGGVGKGGNIDLKAGSLSITDGAQLQTIVRQADGMQPAGRGDAGNVSIDVRGAAKLDGVNRFPSGILSYVDSGATGNAGDIKFSAGSLDIINGARLSSSTLGTGNAGNVNINVGNALTLAGVKNGFYSGVFSTVEPGGVGKGGNIDLKAGSLDITDGAELSSSTYGTGNAGNVSINVGNAVTLSGLNNGFSSAVFSTVEPGGVGKGGNIDLKAGSLSITDGAQLQTIVRQADGTQPAGRGDAGNVSIDVRGSAKLDGVNRFPSGILSYVDSGATGNAGDIKFSAGSLDITNGAQLSSSTYGTGNAGNVSIDVGNAVTLSGLNNGFTSAVFSTVESGGVGKGGNIDLKAGSLSITDGAELSSSTYGTGNAGNVNINVGNSVTLARTSAIFSTVEAGGVGKGGNIDLKAGSLSITDGAQLQTIVRQADGMQPAGRGDAGNVSIDVRGAAKLDGVNVFPSAILSFVDSGATGNAGNIKFSAGSLDITNGARLISSTFGFGNAGNVNINVGNAVTLAGVNNGFYSGVFSTVESGGRGSGGNIDLKAGSLDITDGAQLQTIVRQADGTQPAGKGNAGNVSIDVRGSAKLDGVNGFPSGILSLVDSGATGNAGDIKFSAGSLDITNGARLISSTFGFGNAGNVNINVGKALTLAGVNNGFYSGVFSTVEPGGVGKGGNIDLKADSLSITDGAALTSSTFGTGNAGDISVRVDNAVSLTNGSQIRGAVESGGIGKGAGINIQARSLFVDGSQINVSSQGTGDAGKLEIKANSIRLDNQGKISAETVSGQGGDITLNVKDFVFLRHKSTISATAGTEQRGGDGGNITINSPFIVSAPLENSDITANAYSGKGGRVTINAQGIFWLEPRSRQDLERLGTTDPSSLLTNDITAISQQNPSLSGQVTIRTPDVDPSRGLLQLPTVVVNTPGLVSSNCNAFSSEGGNSFTVTGRGGLPPSPDEPLTNDVVWSDTRLPKISSRENKRASVPIRQTKVVEIRPAIGWVFNDKGEVTLISRASGATADQLGSATHCLQR